MNEQMKDAVEITIELQEKLDKIKEYIKKNQYQHEWTDGYGFRCTDDRYILEDSQYILKIIKGDKK